MMYLQYLNLHQYHDGFRFLFTSEMKLRQPYTSGRDKQDTVDGLFKPRPAGINLVPRVFSYPSLQVGERVRERGWAGIGMLRIIKARLSGEALISCYLAKWGAIVGFHMTSLKFKLKNYQSYRDFTFTMH